MLCVIGITWRGGGGEIPPPIFFFFKGFFFFFLVERGQRKKIKERVGERDIYIYIYIYIYKGLVQTNLPVSKLTPT